MKYIISLAAFYFAWQSARAAISSEFYMFIIPCVLFVTIGIGVLFIKKEKR